MIIYQIERITPYTIDHLEKLPVAIGDIKERKDVSKVTGGSHNFCSIRGKGRTPLNK